MILKWKLYGAALLGVVLYTLAVLQYGKYLGFPELAKAIAEVIKSEMEFAKKEMADMKSKVEKMSAEPAVEKTLPKKTFSIDTKNTDVVDPKRYAMMREIVKSKPKNFNPTN